MKVSVLLLTFNEAQNLPAILDHLAWCDDIVSVDSGSTDSSIALLEAHGVRILHRPFDNFAQQRNYGLEHGALKHEWVLHLDADEIVTPAFLDALAALEPGPAFEAYNVPSKTIFFGRWLRHAGMYPTYQVRLGHRERLRFVQVGHGQREALPPERVGVFPEPYLHYSFSHGLVPWLHKHVRYARDEAEEMVRPAVSDAATAGEASGGATGRRRRMKRLAGRLPLPLRPLLRFLYVYVLRGGFRDGQAGFRYAFMLAVYEGMIAVAGFERLMPRGPNGAGLRPPPAERTRSTLQ